MCHESSDLNMTFGNEAAELFNRAKCTFEFMNEQSLSETDFLLFLLNFYRIALCDDHQTVQEN